LPAEVRQTLKQQALAITWKVDGQGRCQVEKKEETKKRLSRSPDDMDALNLAYLDLGSYANLRQPPERNRTLYAPSSRPSAADRRGLYGRGQ
jgi:hypothetical protein